MEVFFSRFARTKWFYSVARNDVFFNSCGEKNAVLRVAVLGYWHLAIGLLSQNAKRVCQHSLF